MRTLALWLDYEGTDFHGFGLQPGRRTVQGELERALASVLGEAVRVIPAARTDTGVHARGQVVSFRTSSLLGLDTLQRACNARLPDDVVVTAVAERPPGFNARRHARQRRYRYWVWNAPLPCVLRRRCVYHVPEPLDVVAMDRAARALVGTHDFRSFASQLDPRGAASTVRTITRAEWSVEGPLLAFDIAGNAFLRHMVRGIVGTLLEVGRGRRSADEMAVILQARDRRLAGPTAPAAGLMLVGVDFE